MATTTVASRYRVSVQTVHTPDGGIVRLFERDQPIGTRDGYATARRWSARPGERRHRRP
ncbi:MAG: hypothetical protein U0163_11015 [Gemmatimonadaceae bacterium]